MDFCIDRIKHMSSQSKKWLILIILAFVWGSSFILMKKALLGVNQVQLGALRILITAVFLLLIGFKSLKKIKRRHWKYIIYTAILGTFFPAFLFAFALKELDSSIAAILNSLTPFNTFIFGVLFFGFVFKKRQLIGVFIGLVGTLLLILKGASLNPNQNYWYVLLVMIASIGYALNVNMIKKYLSDLNALSITTGNFLVMILPTFFVLYYSDFFSEFTMTETQMASLGYISILAILGTGIAKILFNKLIQISTPVFSSSVTYLIPMVAVFWGLVDGEKLSFVQLVAGCIILLGVYIVNKSK